ncbi:MAG: ABC transporter permease [Treponema sp.]|nr:ABC transporter permease [Treponema sp.]
MTSLSHLKWILFVSRRFSKVDKAGRSAVTAWLSSLGICLGVMTLIVVLSVMNGFQMRFIDAIMEVSSYHIQVFGNSDGFVSSVQTLPEIRSIVSFYEAQTLMVGTATRQAAAVVRAIDPYVCMHDTGFARELHITRGAFDLTQENSIVIGASLAEKLGVTVGGYVNLFALSGGGDVALFSDQRLFRVTGVFHTSYADLNSGYAFISIDAGQHEFGKNALITYGIKLNNSNDVDAVMRKIQSVYPELRVEGWKEYNRSFFGALRIEKNMLLLLVLLIFLVVCINIFNAMRRLVYERKSEISVFSALGAKNRHIQLIFILQGLLTGLKGAIPGLILGLLICVQMSHIFTGLSHILYGIQNFFVLLCNPDQINYLQENPMYALYARIPARIVSKEVVLITISGCFSSLLASWFASYGILKMSVSEVLRDE